ncbi:2-oxo acid dehydrogenase subunit E2 [Brevibacterium sp. p3-SID960]|uniref:dihydrolipoamide acetyltransferase family protein n=1 Tax=Brevibacterium sp. p3-SID960 TaxID=2916063 RepID=UPI0021A33D2A|nr:dihydrolipoamide acetyltransferase family protein [Brevibacterium sp. p3-SID960]MCT1690845.1 2-oxo acid dehydrogenase subunit E2 [Brevibacterium sp. p3-SID960]
MSNLFNLPDVGEGLTEADIVSWKVAVGDAVTVNQILVEIETAKSLVELPSPQAGTISALLVEEGQTVEVGTPIIEFDGDGSGAAGGSDAGAAGERAESGQAEKSSGDSADGSAGPNLVGYGVRADSSKRRPRKAQAAKAAQTEAPAREVPEVQEEPGQPADAAPQEQPGGTGAERPKVLAKPPVRKLAKTKGVDLLDVTPTGARGEVTREDLLSHIESGGSAAQPATSSAPAAGQQAATGTEERIPFKGVTKFMAQAMVDSAFSAPHVTEFLDVDVTAMMELVKRLKTKKQLGEDVRVSPLLIVAKAVCWAALRNPRINSCFDGDDIVVKHYVNLGIAAATPRGLIVPNIKGAHAMGLRDLALELGELTATARAGKTAPADQAGGTITITNVGVFGVDAGTPIINPGEAAILAFGQVRKRPWVVDDEIVARDITTLAVSADHRLVDGEVISKFLADVGRALEDPALMLM